MVPSSKQKYIPVHIICQTLPLSHDDRITIIPLHVFTGCDIVSYLSGHGKKTVWKDFCLNSTILTNLEVGDLQEETCLAAENLICSVYNLPEQKSCDAARLILFRECRSPETLPPTSDAIEFHTQRAHYQSLV